MLVVINSKIADTDILNNDILGMSSREARHGFLFQPACKGAPPINPAILICGCIRLVAIAGDSRIFVVG